METETNFRSKTLVCGCCGMYFKTWPEYVDQDQDAGFGICEPCQGDIAEHERQEVQEAIDLIAANLNEVNREKFLAMDYELQRAWVFKALEDGILTWKVGRK